MPAYCFLDRLEIERAERDVDDAVRAEDDDEPNETPHNRTLPFFTLRLVTRMRNELKHTPEEYNERDRRKKQDYRIDNLLDDFPEERVEYDHLPADLNACRRRAAGDAGIITEADGTGEDVHKAPNGDHHEEANKAPEHEVPSFFLRGVIIGAQNEGGECAPEEDDERDRKEDRDEDVVDSIDNKRTDVRDVIDCSERDERHGEGDEGSCSKGKSFFHKVSKWITG